MVFIKNYNLVNYNYFINNSHHNHNLKISKYLISMLLILMHKELKIKSVESALMVHSKEKDLVCY